ncbi:hypothetical protein LIX17_25205 (plasmid) [Mycobacterium avium subsp. hominissuis]|jgi:hypothetical protein|uniref:Uncharacterized protein n=1 Tax=Mycolicibacterium fluoranthenivorans TaxID=258505 RepID=A0A7X5U5P6_9MYCO|nr:MULTISPECIES: hypothetical protein [Mycobacteriaceae]MBX9982451.1 hypothetical protein [Mycobacterium gordonae]MCV7211978.1 hypothetical protein [Mycolicibacterium canariasense]MCV7354613.1 hypothetical protein [Mycolicibacterium fluoranthenivorans]MCX2714341.1 hypothetical protein [Mycolicibacterium sp. J2]NIH98807.1 hypothetical protein [Mycolicibacterium fluoranthenivorans]|tara:strand:+ start:274 stop:420 length:147 start_codon:yes stop_codon:yes gene_type:complete
MRRSGPRRDVLTVMARGTRELVEVLLLHRHLPVVDGVGGGDRHRRSAK